MIYCIIATYNSENYIRKCLNCLKKSSYPIKIVIVDNCSQDNTLDILTNEYTCVTLFKLKENIGFGKANNVGIEFAYKEGASFFFLLNHDVYVEATTVDALISQSKKYPEYGILSPIHCNSSGKQFDRNFALYINNMGFDLFSDLYWNQKLKEVYTCSFINAAAWFVTRHCIAEVGGFDPIFDHYGEDEDYINRVEHKKISIGICTKTVICHDREPGNQLSKYSKYYRLRLKVLIHMKNIDIKYSQALMQYIKLFLIYLITDILKLKFNNISVSSKVFFNIIRNLKKIENHRKICLKKSAFLNCC